MVIENRQMGIQTEAGRPVRVIWDGDDPGDKSL